MKTKKVYIPLEEYKPGYLFWVHVHSENYSKMNTPDKVMIGGKEYFLSICYESVNSFFIADNIENAQAIFMFASESFFGKNDIYGKEQYFNICRLRSIENRKPVVKCSNDGISFYCDEKGIIKYIDEKRKDVYKRIDIIPHKGENFL